MSDSDRDNLNDSLSDEQLDRLLASAEWPSTHESLEKLTAAWGEISDPLAKTTAISNSLPALVNECLEQPVAVKNVSAARHSPSSTGKKGSRIGEFWKTLAVVAGILILPFAVGILFPPVVQIARPVHAPPRSGIEALVNESDKMRESVGESNNEPIPTGHRLVNPTVDDMYASIVAGKRRSRNSNSDRSNTLLHRAALTIGQSDLLSATLEVSIANVDQTMIQLSKSQRIGDRQLAQSYVTRKRRWERWIWNQTKGNRLDKQQQLALARIGTILTTSRSLTAVVAQVDTELESVSVRTVVRLGNVSHLERCLRETSRTRSQKLLLSRLLTHADSRSASVFLKYLKRAQTKSVAIQLLQSTDMLPTEIWLQMISAGQGEQWDAAYAVSHVCDAKATGGLIELAMTPGSAKPALLALLVSHCDDAKQFVAFAERDELLASQVYVARKKLKQFERMFN